MLIVGKDAVVHPLNFEKRKGGSRDMPLASRLKVADVQPLVVLEAHARRLLCCCVR